MNRLHGYVGGVLRIGGALRLIWVAAPGWAVASAGLIVSQALVPVAALVLSGALIDALAAATGAGPRRWIDGSPIVLAVLLGLVLLVGGLLRSLAVLVNDALVHRLTDHVQALIHTKSVALDLSYFETPEYHDHLHRAQREGGYRPGRILAGLTGLARNALSFLGIVAVLATLDPWIVPIALIGALPSLPVRIRHSTDLFRWRGRRTSTERAGEVLDWVLTNPLFAKDVRLFAIGSYLRDRYRAVRDRLRGERVEMARRRVLSETLADAWGVVALTGALVLVVLAAVHGRLTVGAAVICLQGLQRGFAHLEQILGSLAGLYEDSLFVGHLFEFLGKRPALVDPAEPVPFPRVIRDGIVFDRVSFRYPGASRRALDDVRLHVAAGEITAVVGENGAGKTTLAKLVCRLYDPEEGRILLGGTDLRAFALGDLRGAINAVLQDFARFPASVRENIGFGDLARLGDERQIVAAAHRAGIHDTIAKRPGGYEALLGTWFEGGHELSQGEWQRLALARAFVRDSPIVVLDEPTSFLDPLAEADMYRALFEFLRGRTALVISHKLTSVSLAHRIYVLADGRVAESGTHEELLRSGGRYATMYETQAARFR